MGSSATIPSDLFFGATVIGLGCFMGGFMTDCFMSNVLLGLFSGMGTAAFVSIVIGHFPLSSVAVSCTFAVEDSMAFSVLIMLGGSNKGMSSQHVSRIKSGRSFVHCGSKCSWKIFFFP